MPYITYLMTIVFIVQIYIFCCFKDAFFQMFSDSTLVVPGAVLVPGDVMSHCYTVSLDGTSVVCTPHTPPPTSPTPILLAASVSSPHTSSTTALRVAPGGDGRWSLGLPKGMLSSSLMFELSFMVPRCLLTTGSWALPIQDASGPLGTFLSSVPKDRLLSVCGSEVLLITAGTLGTLLQEGCYGDPIRSNDPNIQSMLTALPTTSLPHQWQLIATSLMVGLGTANCSTALSLTTNSTSTLKVTTQYYEPELSILKTLDTFERHHT